MMLSFRENEFPHRRSHKYKVGLGNNQTRYNSEVTTQRNKVYINSTRNSQDVPEWMSRTQRFFQRSDSTTKNRSLCINPEGSFMQTQQKWVYQQTPQSKNLSGQFHIVARKKARSKWEMKGNTYEFEWPKNIPQIKLAQPKIKVFVEQKPRINSFFKYQMPKYGLKQSPLHRQRQTPIKIGHSSLINSTYIH